MNYNLTAGGKGKSNISQYKHSSAASNPNYNNKIATGKSLPLIKASSH